MNLSQTFVKHIYRGQWTETSVKQYFQMAWRLGAEGRNYSDGALF
jgi:hypothetical protein